MSTEIGALATALSKAQKTMKGAQKDSTNPHFKSKYADLASVWDAARDALTANALSVVQGASADGANVTVTTLLLHESGQWVKDSLTAQARDAGPQSVGSCITYGRRYGLSAMVGIAPEDDDAEQATRQFPSAAVTVPPPVPRAAQASAPNAGTSGTSQLAAEINAGIAAGVAKGAAAAAKFKAPVKTQSRYAPATPQSTLPQTDDVPPLTDKDIAF